MAKTKVTGGYIADSAITSDHLHTTLNLSSKTLTIGATTVSGHLIPSANITYDLGSSTNRFRDIYLDGTTINLGGTELKKNSDGDIEFKSGSNFKRLVVSELEFDDGTNRKKFKISSGRLRSFDSSGSDDTADKISLASNTTDDLSEGSSNLYFTTARARSSFSASTGIAISNGAISAAAIPNASLTNSSVTINSNSLSLGGTLTLDTDDIGEGSTNLYFTNARARGAISVSGNALSYNSSTGVLTANYEESPTFTGNVTISGNIQQNNAYEIRSKDTGGTVRTIMRVNSSNELEYGWSGNGKVKIMGGGSYTERFSIGTDGNATFSGTISSGAITSTGAIEGASFSDGTISGITFIDEDSFATNSATRVPTQQSIKAYVDAQVAGVVDSAPAALNTLNELAAALGDDANFSTTTSTALGNRLRVDTASQGLTGTQQANAITNLGITATKAELNVLDGITATTTELNYTDGVTSNIQTQLNTKYASGSNPDFTGLNVNTTTATTPFMVSRSGSDSTQVVKVGIYDTIAEFKYIEDTSNEGSGNFGSYRFILGGNSGETDVQPLKMTKDTVIIGGILDNTRGNGNVSAPSTSDHTAGTRIKLYDSSATAFYAIGIESNTMWFQSDSQYKWYEDAVERMTLSSGGNLSVDGTISSGAITSTGAITAQGSSGGFFYAEDTTTGVSNDDLVGGFLFKSNDGSGTAPHYAGMTARQTNIYGSMNLEFFVDRADYENDTPAIILKTDGTDVSTNTLSFESSTAITGVTSISSGAITSTGALTTSTGVIMNTGGDKYWIRWSSGSTTGLYYQQTGGEELQYLYGGSKKFGVTSSGNATFAGTISSGAITSSGNLHAGDGTDISMDASANGQLEIDGNGYQGAIALNATGMHLYHNSSSRDLVLGTNETARLTIGGTGGFNFHSNNLTSVGTISSGAITLSNDSSDMGFGTAKAGSTVAHTASVEEGIFWHTTNQYGIYRTSGTWSSPNYQQLKIKWDTGIEIDGGGTTYGKSGVNILNGNLKIDGTIIVDSSRNISSNNITSTSNSGNASIYIDSTRPTLGFTDTNSFSDANDIYIIRGTSNNSLAFQWYDNSAGTTTTTATFDSSGNATFGGYGVFTNGNIDPDSFTSYAGGIGNIADGGGWAARGLFVHGGGTGDAAAIAHNGSNLYFGIQNGSSANSMSTWMQVSPSKVVTMTNAASILLPTVANSILIQTGTPTLRLKTTANANDPYFSMESSGTGTLSEGFEMWYVNSVGDFHMSTTYNHDDASLRFHTKTGGNKSTSNERFTIEGGGDINVVSGDLKFGGTEMVNANGWYRTAINPNTHDAVSGSWSSSSTSNSWGNIKVGSVGHAYTDSVGGYKQYNLPTNAQTAYMSHLKWSSGGYIDVHGVQSDGGLVFLCRVSTYQDIENSNEGNVANHDGQEIRCIGTRLGTASFTAIRLTNRSGRFHFTGIAFTNQNVENADNGIYVGEQIKSGNLSGIGTISSGQITTSSEFHMTGNAYLRSDDTFAFLTINGNAQVGKFKAVAAQTSYANGASDGMFNALNGYAVGTGTGTTVIDSSRNLTNIGTVACGTITLSNGSHLQTYTSDGTTGVGGVDLPRGGHITFYGNNSNNHSIGSRNHQGTVTDDLRISSYGAIYFDLDSNSNNSSSADFVIGRHGGGTGTMTTLVTISGEDGGITASGTSNFNVLKNTGGALLEIQNGTDGGSTRGIRMWTSTDDNWGFYMGQAGAGKSFSGGTACSGLDGRTSHAIRYRVNDSTTQIGHLFENKNEEALFQIQPDTGNIFARGNVTAYASDERLKTNIKTIENPIEKIKKIRGVEFDWLDNIEETHQFKPKCKRETGVIAQEIEEVIPDAISPAPFNNEYKTVEKDKIVALLIEGMKEQQKQIEKLTARIEELEK